MKKQFLFLLFTLAIMGIAHAGENPMKSLFEFQQKMVRTGSTAAMMELGKMYEQGAGTKQNLEKALEMYRWAKAGGNPNADAAIARVIRTRKTLADEASLKKEQTAKSKQREQQQKQAEAELRAQLERQARARAARAAKAKARQQALARQRAELARLREAQTRANAERAARARAAAAAAAQEKARQQALQQSQQRKMPVETRTNPAVVKKKANATKAETFESNPCKGTAARLMSLCN